MQLVQSGFFIFTFLVSMHIANKYDWARYFSYAILICQCVVIPVLSMIHMGINFKTFNAANNLLKAWLLVYPLIGVTSIVFFFMPNGANYFAG